VVVLANFGIGKDVPAPRADPPVVGDAGGGRCAILIEMRTLQRARTLNELIVQHLVASGEERIDIKKFRYMLEKGRIALLFDGFDELAQRVTYESATDQFRHPAGSRRRAGQGRRHQPDPSLRVGTAGQVGLITAGRPPPRTAPVPPATVRRRAESAVS
jgi:hypothetical protein